MNLHENSLSAPETSIRIIICSVTWSRFLDFSAEKRKCTLYYFPTSSLSFCSPDYFRWKVIERRVFLTTTKNAHWLNLRCGITQIYLIIYPAEFNETEHYSNKIEACLTYIYDVNWMLWMYSYYIVLGTLSIVLLMFRGEGDDLYKRM